MKTIASILLAGLVLLAAGTALAGTAPEDQARQTTLGKYVTAVEAHKMWLADKAKVVIVDCRTAAAYFYLGHTPMGLNIPSRFWTGKWDPEKNSYVFNRNKNFEQRVLELVGKDKTILVLSASGRVSATAVNRLAEAGFSDVYNITDGFDGWLAAKLSMTKKLDPGLVYIKKAE